MTVTTLGGCLLIQYLIVYVNEMLTKVKFLSFIKSVLTQVRSPLSPRQVHLGGALGACGGSLTVYMTDFLCQREKENIAKRKEQII